MKYEVRIMVLILMLFALFMTHNSLFMIQPVHASSHIQSDIGKIFGQINAPLPIQQLGSGATGISAFLTNLVALIYSLAIVVLIFMIIWGAWDWMTSEGDKEKLEGAKRKLVNAFIGIILFAIAFAAIKILGTFTGFKFFT